MMKKIFFIFLFFFSIDTQAKDLGTFGELFPIKERSLLDVIQEQLKTIEQNGGFDALNKEMQQKAKDRLNRPEPVLTKRAEKTTERLFDPSVTLSKDLKNEKGIVFATKGTRVNPLDIVSFEMKLYFIDSDDESQIKWLLKQDIKIRDKIILTNGNPMKLEKQLNKKIYFDQKSLLIKRFKISVVPTVISRHGSLLMIKEIAINE